MYFCYFKIISPLKRAGLFIWTNLNPLHPRMLSAKLVEIGLVVLEKTIFKISSIYFCYFLIISPWKRAWHFIWRNLNPLHQRMLYAKFSWNWPSGSWEEVENRKSLQTEGQTDRRTKGDQKSSLELSAQVS